MAEKINPWLDEGTRYEKQEKRSDVHEMKFKDSTKHAIRILPSKNPDDFPFFGYKQHWIPQNGSLIGKPITHSIDERCAVCEWVSLQWEEIHRLKEEEDMTDKSPEVEALLAKQSKVAGKTRYDMNVYHREDAFVKNEETGETILHPKRVSIGGTVYKEIFGFAKKWGSPSNDKTGYDLEITTTGSKERREYRTIPERDASPLTKDELAALDKCYDLKALRKYTNISEIKKILENAKTPYNEILEFVKEGTTTATKDSAAEVEKEIAEVVKTPAKTKKEEPKVEQPKTQSPPPPAQKEPVVEAPKTEAEPDNDENNLEVYECKGDFDENDKMCSDCPVRDDCEKVQPVYAKAKQLGINVDPRRLTKDVVADVQNAETPAASAPKRGKKIPF